MESIAQQIELLPDTAWEQAVFVCLFIVLVVLLLNWFSKQQDKWQQFMFGQDEKWRNWLDRANCNTAEAMKGVTDALNAVNTNLHSLSDQLDAHDDNAKELVEKAVIAVTKERKTQPRPKN